MRYLFIILIVFITGCTSQKRCMKKFPPKDPIINTVVAYRDTTIYKTIPGEVVKEYVELQVEIPIPDTMITAKTQYAVAQAGLTSNELWLDLIQKETKVIFKLDSVLVYQTDTVTIDRPILVEVPIQTKWQTFVGIGFWVFVGLFMAIVALLIYKKK